MSIISEQVRELRYKADIYNTVGSAWELNRAEAKILQRLLRKAADTIEALSKKLATNGSWIPCSERLPDKDGEHICTQKIYNLSNGKLSGKPVELVEFCNGKWRRAKHLKVIAWQPLPEEYHG